nr:hypothetical protein [Halomonas taeanensis]
MLLKGFLDYRAALHRAGVVRGFQWINGSFVQNIENTESRNPRDIDIVSHFHLPQGETQLTFMSKHHDIIAPQKVKAVYGMDAFPNILGGEADESFTQEITYWYSMWSHRRSDNIWKGFLEVDLAPSDDVSALGVLRNALAEKGGESDE